jgi:phytanoyl-CoA hydroxylase
MSHDFNENGFEAFPGLFSAAEIDRVQGAIDDVLERRPLDVVVDAEGGLGRTALGLLTPEQVQTTRMKVNDLYLIESSVRRLALADHLLPLLRTRLGWPPVLCNSLYLQHGSAQAAHIDTMYMTPSTRKHLIAAWIALEDAHPDAGQLEYYPGSHKIPPYRFADGTYHATDAEEPAWRSYTMGEVTRRGLQKRTFAAKKGDVFLWEAELLHGGSPISDPSRTRKSLVFHYLSMWDCWRHLPGRDGKGWWLRKRPLALSPEIASTITGAA